MFSWQRYFSLLCVDADKIFTISQISAFSQVHTVVEYIPPPPRLGSPSFLLSSLTIGFFDFPLDNLSYKSTDYIHTRIHDCINSRKYK